MLAYFDIHRYLKSELSSERYNHSVNVSKESVKLARHYGYDVKKAELAGMVHDCAKDFSIEKQKYYAKNCGLFVDKFTCEIPEILHAPASVFICREIFKISDIDILTAVLYHATGREGMSLLEKIIYIADVIEPSREFGNREDLKKLAYDDLDAALLFAFDLSISYIIEKKTKMHPDTVFARNYILNTFIHI